MTSPSLPTLDLSVQERSKLMSRGYTVGAPFAAGGFGSIYRGTIDTIPLAVKVIQTKGDNYQFVFTELFSIMKVSHPNVVTIYEIFVNSKSELLIFMELGNGGDLNDFVWKSHQTGLSEDIIRKFYCQFGDAFRHMHQLGIAHLDIKSSNILLDSTQSVCKVTDFGLSLIAYDQSSGRQKAAKCYRSTIGYVAPEMITCWFYAERFNPFKADVWSAGVVLYEMLNRCMPFIHMRLDRSTGKTVSDYDYMLEVQMEKKFSFQNKNLSQGACNIIMVHLEPNPKLRPDFASILEYDPWLNTRGVICMVSLIERMSAKSLKFEVRRRQLRL